MNLITDSILTLSGGERVSLPKLFAALSRGEVRGFPALRPHQRPAWHMFLVQLGALALWTAGRDDLPEDAADWSANLRKLTEDCADDAPWRLFVEEPGQPAFLQPPDPGGLKWSSVATPDKLDLLITSRNHDLKQTIARQAAEEDWVFALVSLQTSGGYDGRGNCGVARMNGGSSSRPMVALSPVRNGYLSVDPSAWWARDVRILLLERTAGQQSGAGTIGGPALLWCIDWPEGQQLAPRDLDPWFIEVCRRVRLTNADGALSARGSTSRSTRIDAKAYKGNVGDPWAPVHKTEGKSFTLSGRDFDYTQLCELMFSGDWAVPPLAQFASDETEDMLLVAEALARGNSKTEGFKSRVVPVPGRVVSFFSSDTLATFSKVQMDEIKGFDTALRDALVLVAAGGDRDRVKKEHYKRTVVARRRFDHAADRLFFPSLWNRVTADASGNADEEAAAKAEFLSALRNAAITELQSALPAIPCPTIQRPRAEARAWRTFHRKVRKEYPVMFQKEDADVVA